MVTTKSNIITGLLFGFLALHTFSAGAQSALLEEVVVTAQRRAESLQDIPASVSALQGEDLEKLDISSAVDLQNYVPNLSVRSNAMGSADYTIRGVGKADDNITTDSGVGVFLDDIYLPRNSSAAGTMLDLERVEVLRGPQGTLYGRNTSGGSINYVTSKPDDTFRGKVSVDVGNYEKHDFKGVISGPLVENTLFAKMSAYSLNDEGYMVNSDGSRGRQGDSWGGRIGLRMLPTDSLELLLSADYEKTQPGPNLATLGPKDGFYSQIFLVIDVVGRPLFGLPPLFAAGLPAEPDYTSNVNFVDGEEFESHGFTGRLNLALDDVDVSLIGGIRFADTYYNEDTDRTTWDIFNELHAEDAEWGSVELRLVSNPGGDLSVGGRLNWTAGLYYFYEDTQQEVGLGGTQLYELMGVTMVIPPLAGVEAQLHWDQGMETDAYAAFAEAGFSLTDRFTVIGGLRYTHEKKTFAAATEIIDPSEVFFGGSGRGILAPHPQRQAYILEIYNVSNSKSWDDVLGKIALEFELNNDVLLYGLVSQGFKSGGFSGTPSTAAGAGAHYNPENVLSFEGGVKATTPNDRLRANVAFFYTEFDDLQAGLFDAGGGTPIVVNQDAEILGIEVEAQAALTEKLQLGFNLGWLDTEIVKDETTPANEGRPIFDIPELTFNVNLTYAFPFSSYGEVEFRADYVWEDEVFGAPGFGSSPQWDILGLRAAFTPNNGNWSIALWGRNVLDEMYWNANGLSLSPPGAPMATPRKLAAPATYGATFSYSFGEQ